jgi:2C-methyl-D-erythritol 2,4-cyclodiphosphate synthase
MGEVIAAAMGVDVAAVNVKASTGNLIGPEGMGRSVSASAVVMVVPESRDASHTDVVEGDA